MKAIVTLAYPYPPQQMLALCGSLLDIVIAIMKLFPAEARIQDGSQTPSDWQNDCIISASYIWYSVAMSLLYHSLLLLR